MDFRKEYFDLVESNIDIALDLFEPYNYKLEFFLQTSQIDVISWENVDDD